MWWGKLAINSSRAEELSLAFTRHSKDNTHTNIDNKQAGLSAEWNK
jgi:hypothetical protein